MLDHNNVKCIQTNYGLEFTKRLIKDNSLTLFEEKLKDKSINHKLIKPYTPRHNGKVECSHRKDNEYFYASHKFYSFNDFKTHRGYDFFFSAFRIFCI
jgi:transposase InsO family protein